jgi:secondary thiamine-phosphate synthase enzyme
MSIKIKTARKMELVDITAQLQREVDEGGVSHGFCYLWVPHTTAGITINEGADPIVREDLLMALNHMIPANLPFKHLEGNSQAHSLASILGCSKTIWIEDGKLSLGTWQKVFFVEFDGPRSRLVNLRLVPLVE